MLNSKLKSKKMVLAVAVVGALVSSQAIAQRGGNSEERRVQNAGYLGELSERAIASRNLERLRSDDNNADLDRLTDDSEADLKTRVNYWHNVALDTVALDHTPVDGEAPAENAGPTRTSRAMAMIHIAMFESLNFLDEDYESYIGDLDIDFDDDDTSESASIATAAYQTLSALYPQQSARLQALYEEDLEMISENESSELVDEGVRLGEAVAAEIMADRNQDGSDLAEPSFGSGGAVADGSTTFFGTPVNGGTNGIGEWQPDPNTPEFNGEFNLSLGAYWGAVTPFILESGNQFRVEEPPLPGDEAYSLAYNEVASLGGSPENEYTISTGTDDSHFIGNYWGYDGVPLIGVPPRVYNQIASQVSAERMTDPLEYARFLALVNVAMADTAIAAWDSKYYYNYWRPVTGIRVDDGDDNTVTDELWNPVGVSIINTEDTIRATPPFPAYPSGHAAFGASVFEIMREYFGDETAFTFVSDEFNGEGVDPFYPDQPRPLVPVRFSSFTEAQEENGRSRVYNGVHWNFDDTAGQQLGVQVAEFLMEDGAPFQELDRRGNDDDDDDDRNGGRNGDRGGDRGGRR